MQVILSVNGLTKQQEGLKQQEELNSEDRAQRGCEALQVNLFAPFEPDLLMSCFDSNCYPALEKSSDLTIDTKRMLTKDP